METPKYLKSIIKKFRDIDVGGERNFHRDWRVVCVIGFVFISLSFAAIWYLNMIATNYSTEIKASSRTVLTINRSVLDNIVSFYKDQERLFKETKNTEVNVPDPSK